MKFDNFSAVDNGFVNFALSNAWNPFIYGNVLAIDIFYYPTMYNNVSLYPNRKIILQTRRLGAYNGVNEAETIFPKLVQARYKLCVDVLNQTQFTTSATLQLTEQYYDDYLAQLNSTIIPLGYRIDKSVVNNLSIDKFRAFSTCGSGESLLNDSMVGYFPTKYQAMLTAPQLNLPGSCLIFRLMAKNGTPEWRIESGIGGLPPAPYFKAIIQAVSNKPFRNIPCGSYPKTLSSLTIQNNPLLNQLNNDIAQANTILGFNNCKIQLVSGRFPLTMLPQIPNT